MSPDEVIKKLQLLGINITRRTLLNYEKNGFIDTPIRSGKGRGRGRTTEYASNAWLFAYAAYRLIHDEKLQIKYITSAIKNAKNQNYVGRETNDAVIDVEYLLFGYLHAAWAHVPFGGKIIFLRENDLKPEFKDELWTKIENNEPIGNLGTRHGDALVLAITKDSVDIDETEEDIVLGVVMWNSEHNKWESKELEMA